MKNSSDTGVNHHFSGKTVQRWGTINEKQKKEAFVEVRLMKNAENKASYPYDERKTRKITLRRDTMNKETAKNSFPSRGKQEFSENWLSLTGGNKKTAKNSFPSRGRRRKQRKTDFPREGKTKISRKYFPKIGKTRKCGKSDIPNLGRTKNGRKWLSQHWEDRKTAKKRFPKLGKNKKSQRLHFPTLGRTENTVENFSNPLDGRFFLFSIHPTP